MNLTSALIQWLLNDYKLSAINDFQLYFEFEKLFIEKKYKDYELTIRTNANLENTYKSVINDLKDHDYFELYSIVSNRFLLKIKRNFDHNQPKETDLICSVFSGSYVHLLSGMRIYSITDRIPKKIQLAVPERGILKKWANSYIHDHRSKYNRDAVQSLSIKNIDFYKKRESFYPVYPSSQSYFGVSVLVQSTKHPLKCINMYNGTKVVEIGCLFMQMVNYPDECGGIQHVIDTYNEYGKFFTHEISQAGNEFPHITQARAGFILDKMLGLNDPNIMDWKKNQTQGGSRKFISNKPFINNISLDWCLSLNHDIFKGFGTVINE